VSLQHGVLPGDRARSRPSSCAAMVMRKRGESGSATRSCRRTVWLRTGTYRSLPRDRGGWAQGLPASPKAPVPVRPDEVASGATGPTLPDRTVWGGLDRGSQGVGDRKVEVEPREKRLLAPPRRSPERSRSVPARSAACPSPRRKGRPRRHAHFQPCQVATRRGQRIPQERPEDRPSRASRTARCPWWRHLPPARRAFPRCSGDRTPPNRLPQEGPCTLRPLNAFPHVEVQRSLAKSTYTVPQRASPGAGPGRSSSALRDQQRLEVDSAGQVLTHHIAGGRGEADLSERGGSPIREPPTAGSSRAARPIAP